MQRLMFLGSALVGVASPITWYSTGSAVDAIALIGMAIFMQLFWLGQVVISGFQISWSRRD